MGGGVEGPPVRGPAGPRFPSLPAATPPLQGRGLRPVRRWSKGVEGAGTMYGLSPGARPCVSCAGGRVARPAGGLRPGPGAWGSGGRPRRRRRHAGAGPVAVAGRCGRTGRRPAVALRAPLHGVGGRAGGTRAAQAWPWGARVQGRRRARCGPHCGPRDQRLAGSVAWGPRPGPGAVGSGGRPRRWRRHAGAGPVAAAGRRGRTGRWSAAALGAPLHGVGVHVGGGGGGLWAGGWVRTRGGRGCSELSRRASPCGRPAGGAAGGGQSRPGSPGRSRCQRGRGRRWGPHPA